MYPSIHWAGECGRHAPGQTPLPPGSHCSRRYTSYWKRNSLFSFNVFCYLSGCWEKHCFIFVNNLPWDSADLRFVQSQLNYTEQHLCSGHEFYPLGSLCQHTQRFLTNVNKISVYPYIYLLPSILFLPKVQKR